MTGGEFSNIAAVNGQHFCVDAGTPTTAPKWVRNIVFSGNHANSTVTAAVSLVSVQDGDNINLSGNALDNNTAAGPTAISIGGAATNANEYGNTITGFPSGSYGTMLDSSFAIHLVRGGVKIPFNAASLQTGLTIDNADAGGNGGAIKFGQNGAVVNEITSTFGKDGCSGWCLHWRYNGNDLTTVTTGGLMTIGKAGVTQGSLAIAGVTSGTLTLAAPAAASGTLTLPAGTTNFTATGGASQVVKQTSAGGAFTAAQLAVSDLSDGNTGSGAVLHQTGGTLTDAINQEFEVATATLTKTSDTTLATITGLSQALTAAKTYHCRGHITGTANASGGLKVALVATWGLTATSTTWTGFTWNATTAVSNTTVTALASNIAAATAVYSDLYIDGSIVVNAGGTINVQGAQNASFATATTFLQGSTFSCVRVN